MGGEFDVGMGNNPMDTGPENDMNYIYDRIAPAVDILPEIASLDCGSLNFGDNNRVHVNTPHQLRLAAKKFREHNIKPILEVIELGHLWFVKKMIEEKIISDPPFIEICLGIPWGAPATLSTLNAFVDLLPENCVWSAYGTFDNQIKFIPEIIKKGGHIRVGLEDNLYLEDKTPAKNIDLVQKAVDIIKSNGFEVATPQDARNILNLKN